VISRYLARLPGRDLYGSNISEKTDVDNWLSFALGPLASSQLFNQSLQYLNERLNNVLYLVAGKLTIADLNIFGSLIGKWKY